MFVCWLLNLWGEVGHKEWKYGSSLDLNPIKENTDVQTKRQNNQIWCYDQFECQNQNHDASIRSQHTDIIAVTTDTTLKILSLSTHNIFTLKIPELHKKHVSELRLHLLGSDNGHVVKHWFKTIKIPHVKSMQGSHYICHCPMARLLVHFYSSQLTCC